MVARFRPRRLAALAVVATGLVAAAGLGAAQAQDAKTVWSGVYSAPQAERGASRYAAECAMCHGAEMTGGGGVPGLTGIEFLFGWNNKSAAELFDYLKANMPPGQPGGLSDTQYVDVLAAMFKANGFPPATDGEMPSTRDGLSGIRITRDKPQ